MTASDTAFLTLSDVAKSYGDVAALKSCSLEIKRGEFVTLLGPSGCGKTTTLRIIAGFVRPDTGTVSLEGEVLSGGGRHTPPERRDIGMVFQSYAVWPHMSVAENVGLPLKLRRTGSDERKRRVHEMLALCRLDKLAERAPHQLSGGQLQRVALARALVYRPRLVLLDEPLSNLDVALREELRAEIYRLHKALAATFVLVTHDQVEAMSLSDRVVVMSEGRIEQVGAPEEIYRAPRTEFVATFVGAANVLSGMVVEVLGGTGSEGRCRIDAGGLSLELAAWPGATPGSAVRLAIHPEAFRLHPATATPQTSNPLTPATIATAHFLGRTQEFLVDVGSTQLRIAQTRGRTYKPGEKVLLEVSPDGSIRLPS